METSAEIEVGDWVVAGVAAQDVDYGRIVELDGDVATVAWANDNGTTTCDLSRDDVDVYGNWSSARDAAARRQSDAVVAS